MFSIYTRELTTGTTADIPGLSLLDNLFSQGGSTYLKASLASSSPPIQAEQPPLLKPPSIYIQLLATLLAHPRFTTHIPLKDRDHEITLVSAYCERILLRSLNLAGARGLGVSEAWRFRGGGGGGEIKRRRGDSVCGGSGVGEGEGQWSGFDDDRLDLQEAKRDGLFERVEDFWALVGWAFTCSCGEGEGEAAKWMKKRWEGAWRRLVAVMVEGLERDWVERGKESEGLGSGGEAEEEEVKGRRGALILTYLPETTGSAGLRRVIRAVFANGKGRIASEWKEVWAGEARGLNRTKTSHLREPSTRNGNGKATGKKDAGSRLGVLSKANSGAESLRMDFFEDNDELDFDGDEDEDEEEDQEDRDGEGDVIIVTPRSAESVIPDNPMDAWGGAEAVVLRRRILILVSRQFGSTP